MGVVRACTCQHESQDEIYGKGQRLHTDCKPSGGKYQYDRCTVCSNEKQKSSSMKAEKKAEQKKGK